MHPELAVGAFLASVLVLVPFPWHWRARNTATLSIMAWLFVSNVTYAVRSIIWSGRTDEVVPVWCDIVTKVDIGATAALPACSLSLAIQLWRVASDAMRVTHKRTTLILDLTLCWGYPALTMILHYIVQGHRFDIFEDLGCRPETYVSIPTIFLLYGPISVVVVLTFVFSGLGFATFYRRRRTFAQFLKSTNSSFTTPRYLRLMAITVVLAVWGAAVIGVVFWLSFRDGIRPYKSWAFVHSDFSRVIQFPTALVPPDLLLWSYVSWWTIPVTGYIFFCFFSFGEDAVKEYGPWFGWVARGGKALPPSSSEAPRWTIDDTVVDIKYGADPLYEAEWQDEDPFASRRRDSV
ncbi:GPCR fungal pheromone mating factor [Mycena epipterygia]|nr:GPCR fungal pheromone mating factor [Mycena epipterygia]